MTKFVMNGAYRVLVDNVDITDRVCNVKVEQEEIDITAFGDSSVRMTPGCLILSVETDHATSMLIERDRKSALDEAPPEVAEVLERLYALSDALPADKEAVVDIVPGVGFRVHVVDR